MTDMPLGDGPSFCGVCGKALEWIERPVLRDRFNPRTGQPVAERKEVFLVCRGHVVWEALETVWRSDPYLVQQERFR